MTTHYELAIAPRLEADIYNFYIQARNLPRRNDEDKKAARQQCILEFKDTLMVYVDYCQRLMHLDKPNELSFWLLCFQRAYFAVLNRKGLSYYLTSTQLNSALLREIAEQLLEDFNTVTFENKLNLINERHRKMLARIDQQYQAMNKVYVNPRDICFNFGFYDVLNQQLHLKELDKIVKRFEKRLNDLFWYRHHVCFALRHIHRDAQLSRYIMTLCLSFNRHHFEESRCDQIERELTALWYEVSEWRGVSLDKVNSVMQTRGQITLLEAVEVNSLKQDGIEFCLLDYLLELPQGESIVISEKKALCVTHLGVQSLKVIKK
ncbi:hypothetical protein [Acinetobacter schindleri]|uniref:Uncharacterized protein n=1 Tax=Acinetobacter schindleri TaxID=108981 RepID=A0AAE7BXK3_9GAMM|nr:hypothetical protein [Acinetobacter schindleri]QIC67960.1 hypothetical protein FSC10_11600 [Acinetobacter schindleri]